MRHQLARNDWAFAADERGFDLDGYVHLVAVNFAIDDSGNACAA